MHRKPRYVLHGRQSVPIPHCIHSWQDQPRSICLLGPTESIKTTNLRHL